MKIHRESIHHYLAWMRGGDHFCFAGYSDAEWYCVLGQREGELTGLGQRLSAAHGSRLLDVLRRRQGDPRFLFAVPHCLWPHEDLEGKHHPGYPGFAEGQIDWFLGSQGIAIEGWERDRVLDDLARKAGLHPLISQLQSMPVCVIGPAELRGTQGFLRWRHFVEVESPNLHLADGGIERAVEKVLRWRGWLGKGMVCLVSAGVSAAVIIDRIYEAAPDNWCIDCGSIWDGFVRIGGQRQWRADLYADDARWQRWVHDNLEGKQR